MKRLIGLTLTALLMMALLTAAASAATFDLVATDGTGDKLGTVEVTKDANTQTVTIKVCPTDPTNLPLDGKPVAEAERFDPTKLVWEKDGDCLKAEVSIADLLDFLEARLTKLTATFTSPTGTGLRVCSGVPVSLFAGAPDAYMGYATKGYVAGTVDAVVVGDYLVVTFTANAGPTFAETHLNIGPCPDKTAPGQFNMNGYLYSASSTKHVYKIPLSHLISGDPCEASLTIAAHSALSDGQTAWGYTWKGCFDIGLCCDQPVSRTATYATTGKAALQLPETVLASVSDEFAPSPLFTAYWDVSFGSDPANPLLQLPGWCMDADVAITRGQVYQFTVWSSLDPATWTMFPGNAAYTPEQNWNMVNYILNTWQVGDPITTSAGPDIVNFRALDFAFKSLVQPGFTPDDPTSRAWAMAQAIVADAVANGLNFKPGTGELAAVVLYYVNPTSGEPVQPLFVPIDP